MAFQLLVIAVGLVVGWFKKGSVWAITSVRIVAVWILPVAYITQHLSMSYLSGLTYEWVLVLSYLCLLLFCVLNRRTPGVLWTLAGTATNFIVMCANGLRMPAYLPVVRMLNPSLVPALEKGDVGKSIAMTGHTHLNFLGDIFTFNIHPASLISVGDIMFSIGLVIFIQYAMRSTREETSRVERPNLA